jgi:hypothetical protein
MAATRITTLRRITRVSSRAELTRILQLDAGEANSTPEKIFAACNSSLWNASGKVTLERAA